MSTSSCAAGEGMHWCLTKCPVGVMQAPAGRCADRSVLLSCHALLLLLCHACVFRPPNTQEIAERAPQVIQCNETLREVTLYQNINGKQLSRTFRYDKVWLPACSGAHDRDVY